MSDALERRLRAAGFRGRLESGRALARFTTWRIGGPAELLAHPLDRADLLLAARWAAEAEVPLHLLGNGSNLLVRDEGVPGLVLRLRRVLDRLERDACVVSAGAGASFPAVARQVARWGLAGIEFGAGIPGTIGGAIVMNAGWHAHEIGNFVLDVELLASDGAVRRIGREACAFGYRTSRFRGSGEVVLGTRLGLEPGDAAEIAARLEQFAASRKASQPTDWPSCGSVFLKPEDDFAGRLIEQAGLKGRRIGDVEISTLHANFFINRGAARAADVLRLVELAELEVERRFGVRLEREFELW